MLNFSTTIFGDKRAAKPKPLFSVLRNKTSRNKEDSPKTQIATPVTSWCDSAPRHHYEKHSFTLPVDMPQRKERSRCLRSQDAKAQFLGGCHHQDAIVARQAALDKLCGRQPTLPSPPLSPVCPPRRRTARRHPPSPLPVDSNSSVSSASSRDHSPSLRRKHSRRPLVPASSTHHYSQTLTLPSPRHHHRTPPSPRSYRNTPLTPPYMQQQKRTLKADEDDNMPLIHTLTPQSSHSEYLGLTHDHNGNHMLDADMRRSFDFSDSENESISSYSSSESESDYEDRVVSLTQQMRSIVVNDRTRVSPAQYPPQ